MAEVNVTFTLVQNVTIETDGFEAIYGRKPTPRNLIDVATGMRGYSDENVQSGGEIIVETVITDIVKPEPAPKIRRGCGSY